MFLSRHARQAENRVMDRTLTLFALGLTAGCASATDRRDSARARAVHDLPCPAESINVTHLSRDVYRAEGCGKILIYTCALAVNGSVSCSK